MRIKGCIVHQKKQQRRKIDRQRRESKVDRFGKAEGDVEKYRERDSEILSRFE